MNKIDEFKKEYPIIRETWDLLTSAEKDINYLKKYHLNYGESLALMKTLSISLDFLSRINNPNIDKIIENAIAELLKYEKGKIQ